MKQRGEPAKNEPSQSLLYTLKMKERETEGQEKKKKNEQCKGRNPAT